MTTTAPVLALSGERTPVRVLVRDFWAHRDLLALLARQDYKSRYRSASLGLLWAVLLPMLQGLVIAVVFTRLTGGGKASSFVAYVVTGVTIYSFVSSSLTAAATAIVDSSDIAGRIYFPRLVLPLVAPTANLPGAVISTGLALAVTLVVGGRPGWCVLLAPAALALGWLLASSAGALLAMAHVYSRDVRYLVQAAMVVLFYATPVIYLLHGSGGVRPLPSSLVPYVLANPLTGVVQLNRFALTGSAAELGTALAVTGAWVAGLLVATLLVYARRERVACDRL